MMNTRITARKQSAAKNTRLSCRLMMKHMIMLKMSMSGARTAMRMII